MSFINKNHLSLQLIEWWLTIPPISTKITSHTSIHWVMVNNSELKWEVIFVDIGGIVDITQWVDVRCDFCWYWWNCWPSLNEFRWKVIFVDQFHLYQQAQPLILTHWVMVNNSTNINKNHLSP
jgi:hypothetical protein